MQKKSNKPEGKDHIFQQAEMFSCRRPHLFRECSGQTVETDEEGPERKEVLAQKPR